MFNNPLVVALLIIFATAFLTATSQVLTGWQADRRELRAFKRQDEVAARASATAAKLLTSTDRIAVSTENSNGKLDQIHTLVNNNLTVTMQSLLDSTVGQLALLEENIALKRQSGVDPTPDVLKSLEVIRIRIADLKSAMSDRVRQAEILAERNPG